ncbi:unnamed protein product, partial [Nesidiocoris tenuis]
MNIGQILPRYSIQCRVTRRYSRPFNVTVRMQRDHRSSSQLLPRKMADNVEHFNLRSLPVQFQSEQDSKASVP